VWIPTESERRIRAALLREADRMRAEGNRVTVAGVARRLGLGYDRTYALVKSMRCSGEWPESAAAKVFRGRK
jgi:hypothetical protein